MKYIYLSFVLNIVISILQVVEITRLMYIYALIYLFIQIPKDVDDESQDRLTQDRRLPLPEEYMRILRQHDRDDYERRRQQQTEDHTSHTQSENMDDYHDDGMDDFLNDWFQPTNDTSSQEEFLREEATKSLYPGCTLTRLSASLIMLNLQNRFGWSNASISALCAYVSYNWKL